MEIWRHKNNVVTTLTFWGHVTSSVTWSFDSRWSNFYGWFYSGIFSVQKWAKNLWFLGD